MQDLVESSPSMGHLDSRWENDSPGPQSRNKGQREQLVLAEMGASKELVEHLESSIRDLPNKRISSK